jgi:hypothetical protein
MSLGTASVGPSGRVELGIEVLLALPTAADERA